ncbi:MAG: aminomethyl transferase family protein [Gammaproteobacteria bacterium]|nr:aminomethyl transferase family protein [Gammaproteobacteria bacterium]
MSELSRTSALASRHRALGSGLEDWNGMGTAWSYHSDPNDEHDAVREAAGMFDMSPLKKVLVRGPDAARVVDHVISRDMIAIAPGKSAYGAILTEQGTVCDDAIIANNGADEWMHCHGSGESMERLHESAAGFNVDIELDDDLHNISLQGPKALQLLDAHTPIELGEMAYFHHQATELFGHPCRLSRTGYSGERGYEIFARAAVIGDIWDQILGHGSDIGILPCSFTALDKVRIEAALLFFGYDMTAEHTPWEVGLGFTVNLDKSDFRGRDAVIASQHQQRFVAAGISIDYDDALAGGETLQVEGNAVGVLNCPCWSHRLNKSLALAHLQPDAAAPGTRLQVISDEFNVSATVEAIPFFDPHKSRTHVSGQ